MNISLFDSSFNYINSSNFTVGLVNGTFNHSLCNDNLSSFTQYYWNVSTSCNGTHNVSDLYNFYTEVSGGGCDCDDIRVIVRNELNRYNALKESDNVNLGLESGLLMIVLIGLFFWFATTRKSAFLFMLCGIISFVTGIYYILLELSTTYTIIAVSIIGFSFYSMFLALVHYKNP